MAQQKVFHKMTHRSVKLKKYGLMILNMPG